MISLWWRIGLTKVVTGKSLTDYKLDAQEVEQQRHWPHEKGIEEADEREKERHLSNGPEAEHSLVYDLVCLFAFALALALALAEISG